MSGLYADTAFLCSLLATDANTRKAVAYMDGVRDPLAWTALHELEFRNAIRLQIFQGRIDASASERVFSLLADDLSNGVYEMAEPQRMEVSREAERLSATHTARLGTRSLDVLHVAQAVALEAKDFLTFDKRQAALAKAAGLRVPKL